MDILANVRTLAIGASILAVFLAGAWINGMRWEARHAAYVADVESRTAQAQAQARSEEQRRQTAIEEIRQDAQSKIAEARTDAATADAAAERLRARIKKLADTASGYTGITPRGEAARDPIILLADVLTEMERAGRELAREADARGIAGHACERAYDSLTQAQAASATEAAK